MPTLYRERLAATSGGAPELVLLHGWASDCSIWRSLLPGLREHFTITLIDLPGFGGSRGLAAEIEPEALLRRIMPALPSSALYVGWSLGGMLATLLAARYPARVSGLITLATNAVFVADQAWPTAMAQDAFQQFADGIAGHLAKGLKRFNALQVLGDDQGKTLLRRLEQLAMTEGLSGDDLGRGLLCLSRFDNRQALKTLAVPALHLFGQGDSLVPAGAAARMADELQQQTQVLPGCGHLLLLSQANAVVDAVVAFARGEQLLRLPAERLIDKRRVARSFSRAAPSYDSVAQLQRRVADQLQAALPSAARSIVDLGCGTGYSLPALAARAERLVALDLAEGMVGYAARTRAGQADYWVCGDAEDLPLADTSVDLVFSSLSLQWCENFAAVCAELHRVLTPGGQVYIATLGPDTLFELREAWREVDGYTHVNNFASRQHLHAAIQASGLILSWWQEAREVIRYRRVGELTRELKSLGASNVNDGRPGGLAGRRRVHRFTEAYERYREADGLLPASYQVWYLCLQKQG